MTAVPKKKKKTDLSHGNDSTNDSIEDPQSKKSSIKSETEKFLSQDFYQEAKKEIKQSKTAKVRDHRQSSKKAPSGGQQQPDDKECIIF